MKTVSIKREPKVTMIYVLPEAELDYGSSLRYVNASGDQKVVHITHDFTPKHSRAEVVLQPGQSCFVIYHDENNDTRLKKVVNSYRHPMELKRLYTMNDAF